MANGLSQYALKKLLEHAVGKNSFTMPSTVGIALCTAAVTDADTGATITEATYTSYARKAIAASDLAAASVSASVTSDNNANELDFAACTGSTSTVTHFAVLDSTTTGAGNMLWFGPLPSSLIVTNGVTPYVPATTLIPSLTNASGLSDFSAKKLVDHILGKTSWTMPATPYLALVTVTPTETDTGSSITEATYTGYARLAWAGSNWATATADATHGVVATGADAIFGACTAGTSTLTYAVLVDASSAGNVLVYGALSPNLSISNNITPKIPSGSLTVTITNS